jgi:hypothetical protein
MDLRNKHDGTQGADEDPRRIVIVNDEYPRALGADLVMALFTAAFASLGGEPDLAQTPAPPKPRLHALAGA